MKSEMKTPFGLLDCYLWAYDTAQMQSNGMHFPPFAVNMRGVVYVNGVEYKATIEFKCIDSEWKQSHIHMDRTDGKDKYSLNALDKFGKLVLDHWKVAIKPQMLADAKEEYQQKTINRFEEEIVVLQATILDKQLAINKLKHHWKA